MNATATAPTPTVKEITFSVPSAHASRIAAKLEKLNKLAARNGLNLATITMGEAYEVSETTEFGFTRQFFMIDGTLHAPKMGLDGWTLAGTLDHDAAGNIVRTVPGFAHEIPAEFRSTDAGRCDHCNLVRNRAKTIVVRHDDGTWMQVGGDCVKVILGMSAESVLSICDEVRDLEEGFGMLGAGDDITVTEWLAATALVVALYGFKSKAACDFGGTPTSSIVAEVTRRNPGKLTRESFAEFFAADAVMIARANVLSAAAIEWASTLTGDSDFDSNMRTAAARSFVGKNGGILAYAIEGARKASEGAAAKVAADTLPASEYVGTEGAKVTLAGCKVVYTNRSEGYSYHGPDSLYVVLLAADGTKASLNTTVETAIGQTLENAATDARFDIAGAVKAHKLYKGERTTVLTRCKVIG